MAPSVPSGSDNPDTMELANARAQDTANIRLHLQRQARCAERRNTGGASRALAPAILSTNWTASELHRPSVSIPTTTRRHLSPTKRSLYFASLSRLAAIRTAPLVCAAFELLRDEDELVVPFSRKFYQVALIDRAS